MNAHPSVPIVKTKKLPLFALAIASFCFATPNQARAQGIHNVVDVFGVSDYSTQSGSHGSDIPGAVPNAQGFQSTMVSNGWTAGLNFTTSPNQVIDNGFVDPEKYPGGADTTNFDRPGTVVSYVAAHGTAGNRDYPNNQGCHATSDCTNPPAGMGPRGACIHTPGYSDANGRDFGTCMYTLPRYIVTSSTSDIFGHLCRYSDGNTKWGESTVHGPWAGAGTNGGINLAVLDISHGTEPGFTDLDLLPVFAGIHLVATIMPIYGDTAMVSNRGSVFASKYGANQNSSVGQSWLDTMNSLPLSEGIVCQGSTITSPPGTVVQSPLQQYGGGRGINGCGANIVVGDDVRADWASWRVSGETWTNLQDDSNDASGTGFYSYYFVCNYDCNTYPIQI